MKTNFRNFNPDQITLAEVQEWLDFIGDDKRPTTCAKLWFAGRTGRLDAVRYIRGYLQNLIAQAACRAGGDLRGVQYYTDDNVRIRSLLPYFARW